MKANRITSFITGVLLSIVCVFLGYELGTYKVNKCKTMSPQSAFEDKECREFFLGGDK